MVVINTRLEGELLDKFDMLCALDQRSRAFKLKHFTEKSVRKYEQEHGEIVVDSAILEKFRSQFRRSGT